MLFVDPPGAGDLVNLTSCKLCVFYFCVFYFCDSTLENYFAKTLASFCSLKVFIFLDFIWIMLKV